MSDDISEELIRIIKSYSNNNNDLVRSIYYLLNADVLNNKEQKVCDDIVVLNNGTLNEITHEQLKNEEFLHAVEVMLKEDSNV